MSETEIEDLIERLEANWDNDSYKDHEAFYIAAKDPKRRIFQNDNSCFNAMKKIGLKIEPIPLTKADYKQKLEALKTQEEDAGYPEDKPVTKWEKKHLANWLNEKDVQFDVDANKPELLKLVQDEMAKLETPS